MFIFDSITRMAEERFNLESGKAGGLVSSLLALIISDGGLSDFLARFRNAGLGGTVDSWITDGNNTPLSNQKLESALGADTLSMLAGQAGVERLTATSAMAAIIPQIVDRLTPDSEIAIDNEEILSKLRSYVGGLGGGALGAVGAAGAFDRVGNATGGISEGERDAVHGGINLVGNVGDSVGNTVNLMRTIDNLDTSGDSSILKWLVPLGLLGLIIALGFWFCGKSTPTTVVTNSNGNANLNANANRTNVNANLDPNAKAVDSSFSI